MRPLSYLLSLIKIKNETCICNALDIRINVRSVGTNNFTSVCRTLKVYHAMYETLNRYTFPLIMPGKNTKRNNAVFYE